MSLNYFSSEQEGLNTHRLIELLVTESTGIVSTWSFHTLETLFPLLWTLKYPFPPEQWKKKKTYKPNKKPTCPPPPFLHQKNLQNLFCLKQQRWKVLEIWVIWRYVSPLQNLESTIQMHYLVCKSSVCFKSKRINGFKFQCIDLYSTLKCLFEHSAMVPVSLSLMKTVRERKFNSHMPTNKIILH